MSDLLRRLRNRVHDSHMHIEHLLDDSADEIERQSKLIDELVEMAKNYTSLIRSDYEGRNGINSSFREEYERLDLLISKAQSHKPNEGQRDE